MTIEEARRIRSEKNNLLPRCSYLNKKGIQCNHHCPNYIEGSTPMCAQHINSVIYKKCQFIEYDSEGKAYECPCFHRTKKEYCGYSFLSHGGSLDINIPKLCIYNIQTTNIPIWNTK